MDWYWETLCTSGKYALRGFGGQIVQVQKTLDKVLYPAIDKFLQCQVAGVTCDLAEIAPRLVGAYSVTEK
jgi:hypothetical protein